MPEEDQESSCIGLSCPVYYACNPDKNGHLPGELLIFAGCNEVKI